MTAHIELTARPRSTSRVPSLALVCLLGLVGVGCVADETADETVAVDTVVVETTVDEIAVVDTDVVETVAPEESVPKSVGGPAAPLYLTLSVHVEGYLGEPDLSEQGQAVLFQNHREAVLVVAKSAQAVGAVVSFEVSSLFVERVATHEPAFLLDLIAMGHDVEVHADIGGSSTLPLPVFTAQLRDQRAALEALLSAREVTHVSGICSRGPWIEAAIAAGFTSTNGAVAYCMTSLLPGELPVGSEWVADCANAADCHGPMTVTSDQLAVPFLVADSRTFLSGETPDPIDDSLVLMVSEAGSSVPCLADGATVARCTLELDDIDEVPPTVDNYLAIVNSRTDDDDDGIAVFSYSWSIGASPDRATTDAFFSAFEPYVSAGLAQWISTGDAGELAGAQLRSGS